VDFRKVQFSCNEVWLIFFSTCFEGQRLSTNILVSGKNGIGKLNKKDETINVIFIFMLRFSCLRGLQNIS